MRYGIVALVMIAGCAEREPDDCPIMFTEVGRAYTQACLAAKAAEEARQRGAQVTTCHDTWSGVTCITE